MRRATNGCEQYCTHARVSIHALLAESDKCCFVILLAVLLFLSTLSLRRATRAVNIQRPTAKFLSTLSLRRATAPRVAVLLEVLFLSTLSLRRATRCEFSRNNGKVVSIHALLAESDRRNRSNPNRKKGFYPRSPCGERPFVQIIISGYARVSIHALLAESDWNSPRATMRTWKFLSTLSLRRATRPALAN